MEELKTVVDKVSLVDEVNHKEVVLKNTTTFKNGEIEDYNSKVIEEKDLYPRHIKDIIWEYRGFRTTDQLRATQNPSLPIIIAISEEHKIPIQIMSVEEFEALPEDKTEFCDKFKEIVDAFLSQFNNSVVEEDEELEEDFGEEELDEEELEEEDEDELEEDEDDVHLTSACVKEVPTMEEALSELGESVIAEDEDIEITSDDIKETFKTSMFNEGETKYNLPDEDILVLLDIVNKVKAKENINIYASFPQSVKDMINKYMLDEGVQGYSVQANSIRNMLSATLIDEFISNISINKTIDSFNQEMEDLFVKTGEEFSKMYKEYDTERTKYLEAALEKIPEGDPKRETITNVLDAINDAYKLTRLKEAAPKLKIKNFDREKPGRLFSDFEFKYKNTEYHIYPLNTVGDTLRKHLSKAIISTLPEDLSEEDKIKKAEVMASLETLDFLLLFCKFCMNYKPDVPEQHAFMYYTLYNIMLLDIYKGEEYKDFADGLIHNIIESYKPYYKKTMSEENFKKRFGE